MAATMNFVRSSCVVGCFRRRRLRDSTLAGRRTNSSSIVHLLLRPSSTLGCSSTSRHRLSRLASTVGYHHRENEQTRVKIIPSYKSTLLRRRRALLFSTGTDTKDDEDDDTKKKQQQQQQHSDPPILTWVERTLPKAYLPYARLARVDKPIGTMLLFWPCCWGTAAAAAATNNISSVVDMVPLLGMFGTGALVMRGAGCTMNDMWDQDIDAKVSRTQTRPLASGELNYFPQAVGFLAFQLSIGLAVLLSLPHTWYCFQWGCLSLPIIALYPATKRVFAYPQLILGLAMNWGVFMGWAAVHGPDMLPQYANHILPLYGSGITWTLLYDTIYAHQDKHEDAKLELHSTALTFGPDEQVQRQILYVLSTLTYMQWMWVGYQADLSLFHTVGATAAWSHLLWQVRTADFDDPHNLAERFRSNNVVGGLVFTSLVAGFL